MTNKRIKILFLSLLLMLIFAYTTLAADDSRLYDQAGLFSTAEQAEIEQKIQDTIKSVHMDIVVVTTADANGKEAEAYADDFYDQGGYGKGKKKSGVLFLIDMDNRQLYISTAGDMIRFLTDSRIENILDDTYDGASSGDYATSVDSFLNDVKTYYKKGIETGQYNYDEETGEISVYHSIRWYEALFAIAVSAFAAGFACKMVKDQYAMKAEHKRSANYNFAYRAAAAFVFAAATDSLINKNVTQRRIVRNNGGGGGFGGGSGGGRSTTHTSSGGMSHGGGGRSF